MTQHLTTKEAYSTFVDNFDTFLFDCDGVLWHGDDLVPGALEVLSLLRAKNKAIIFVTNNATKSRLQYKGKFDKLGVQATEDEIFGSAYASAVYLSTVMKFPKDEKVYVVGMSGLEDELRSEGISYLGGTDPVDNTLTPFSLSSFRPDPAVSVVLAGLDTSLNYTKLSKAFQYLQNPSCRFIVTNGDTTYPASGGTLPGAGAVWSPLSVSSKRTPVIVGKPSSVMMDAIKAKYERLRPLNAPLMEVPHRHHFDPKRTVMVGDRIDTDMAFGKAGGCGTLMVLTGVSKESDLASDMKPAAIPDYIIQSIGDLAVLG